MAPDRPPDTKPVRRLARWALDFPILYKILVANSLLVSAGTLLGSWFATRHVGISPDHSFPSGFTLWFGAAMLAAIVLVNYALLRAALQPLRTLARLTDALRRGELRARAGRPLFGDRDSLALTQTANTLLDELEAYRHRLGELSRRITAQLETERQNIARELHDETAQNLATLLVFEQMLSQPHGEQERERLLEEARRLTRLTLEGVRRMSLGIRPDVLDDAGVAGALHWYVTELMKDVLPRVDLDVDPSLDGLAPETELALYRIAQEALSNVARHARASTVRLSLRQDANAVTLRVTDDGVGFEPATPAPHHREHLGLFTIRERARLAGGQAEIISEPGRGTTVLACLPLRQPAGHPGAAS
ncbi:MAG: sensor histidine kinase [Chloroflexi bacterium]|nr:sensor histidine kinase [Chloroflexota bacterium]